MGNWKARGVGEMIVTVGCEVVTEDTSSSGKTRGKGELITSATVLGGRSYDERCWCRVYGRQA
jgi:hypothetical protein